MDERAKGASQPGQVDKKVLWREVKSEDGNDKSGVSQTGKHEKHEGDALAGLASKVEQDLGQAGAKIEDGAEVAKELPQWVEDNGGLAGRGAVVVALGGVPGQKARQENGKDDAAVEEKGAPAGD